MEPNPFAPGRLNVWFLRFPLLSIFPAPSQCYWVLQLLPSTVWPMLRVSHSLSLLLSLLCFLTVPFFHQTDSALFFLSPCLDLVCGTGSPTMRSVLHGLQCWHSSPSCWEFLWVQSQHSHWCNSIPFLTLCSNNSVLTKTTGVRANQLLITKYHQASVIWQSLEGGGSIFHHLLCCDAFHLYFLM